MKQVLKQLLQDALKHKGIKYSNGHLDGLIEFARANQKLTQWEMVAQYVDGIRGGGSK